MLRFILGLVCAVLASSFAHAADGLWVDLGEEVQGNGLWVDPEAVGDGVTLQAEFGGRACRRTDVEGGSTYVYVHVDDAFLPPGELFATVEFLDLSGMVSLEFDAGEGLSAYRPAPEAYAQGGSQRWRKETFTIRRAGFKNRQNGGADFRVHADGPLAVARIVLAAAPPEGFAPPLDPVQFFAERPAVRVGEGMSVIQQWQIHEPVPQEQLADSAYLAAKRIGITSLQSYVGWTQLEPRPGELDYTLYDPVVAQLRKHDLKWLPFLITAPLIATPEWFREEKGVDSVCLEHGEATPIQSIWNPGLRGGVRRFLEVFRAHYGPEVIEALNLGISGNWGESIVVAGGGFGMQGKHSHLGWWCGDVHAREDWRRWARKRYANLDALNGAWNTGYAAWTEIEPFIPAQAPSRRAAADLFLWYTKSMTDYAEFWVRTARELYPDLPIYLCTGGNGQPELAADFAAQARMCARYGAGIRITNQSDHAPGDFAVTRMVASSTRFYGGYYTTEPGGANTVNGMAARVFDAVSGGARGVYFKTLIAPPDAPSPTAVAFAGAAEHLVPNTPQLTVAALMPNSSLAMDRAVIDAFIQRTQILRDALDFEFIDENMISDGHLARFRALMAPAGDTVERDVLEAIGEWIEAGGVLLIPESGAPLRDVEGGPAVWWPPAANGGGGPQAAASMGKGWVVTLRGEWPVWRDAAARLLLTGGEGIPWRGALSEPLDGKFDNVLATRAGERVYLYNNSDEEVSARGPADPVPVPPREIVALEWPR